MEFRKRRIYFTVKQCQTVHTLTCPQKSATFVFRKWEGGRHRPLWNFSKNSSVARIISENIWFVWSQTSMQDDDNQTRGDRATQPMDAGWPSVAVDPFIKYEFINLVGLSFQTSSQSSSPQFRSVLEKKGYFSCCQCCQCTPCPFISLCHSFRCTIHLWPFSKPAKLPQFSPNSFYSQISYRNSF